MKHVFDRDFDLEAEEPNHAPEQEAYYSAEDVNMAVDQALREGFETGHAEGWREAEAALAILQVLTPVALLDAISVEDHAAIARAQGVGKKIATRIVSELAGKTPDLMALVAARKGIGAALSGAPATAETAEPASDAGGKADAVSALVNLGYDSVIARQAVGAAAQANRSAGVEDLIRISLKELSQL